MSSDGLIVVGRLSYPSGSAPSNRVHLYCKALKEANGFPFVINLNSSFTKPQHFNYLSRYEGVPFYYSQKTPMRQNKLLPRNFNKMKGLINSFIVINRLKKNHKLKILFFSTSFLDELIFFVFLRFLKISTIRECNESPFFKVNENKVSKFDKFLLYHRLKLWDEIIVISDYLNAYYSKIFPKNKIFQIPILVDMTRFSNSVKTRIDGKKVITYIGYLGGSKDGLEILIEAISIVRNKLYDIRLELVGSAPKEDIIRLKNKIAALGLNDIVFFLGSKDIDEIPCILSNSDLLVLARPNNNQAKAGFPTKLGEYLASGKPLVITKTGEIQKYLIDNKSAYLAAPGDINNFADKVIFALNDENAEKIGTNGYDVANKNFNYKLYCKEIIEIIHNKKKK